MGVMGEDGRGPMGPPRECRGAWGWGGSQGWVTSRGLWVNAAAEQPILGVSSLPDTVVVFRSEAMPGVASIVPCCRKARWSLGCKAGGLRLPPVPGASAWERGTLLPGKVPRRQLQARPTASPEPEDFR